MKLTDIIMRPVITEKSHRIIGEQNIYTLAVNAEANKNQIKQAVEELFTVDVIGMNIVKVKAKTKVAGKSRREIKSKAFKKALVKLKKGQKINLFDVEQK
jgi:large subunit ribosomal protein L23